MIRFFPTVAEENAAISDAMRMRGIRLFGLNVMDTLEYRMVPLMMSAVKIGEDLSASALTRGLGAPIQRTNICKIGFSWLDYGFVFGSIVAILLFIL
jgi:energy-coupling factor transport system permease protein